MYVTSMELALTSKFDWSCRLFLVGWTTCFPLPFLVPYPFQRHESRYLHHATAPLADDYLVDIYSALGWYSKSTGCTLPSRFLKLSGNHDLKLIAVDLHFLPLCWYSSEIKNLKYMTNGVSTCCKYWYVGKNIKKDWYEYLIGAANFEILELAAQSSRCLPDPLQMSQRVQLLI